MNDEPGPLSDLSPPPPPPKTSKPADDGRTIWSSSLYKVCEEMINLRERNNREHKLFTQDLSKARDAIQASFNSFAADTQRAYQQLRQEIHGEKRISMALLNELLDLGLDLEHIVAARPKPDDAVAVAQWMGSIEVESRKIQDSLRKHGIVPYDAVLGSAYNPAIHERVGSMRKEGMGPLLVAEQRERGYASQQPEFVLRRPKVIVSE
jgi:molecular chaperone GrpE (heat shock protein)